MNKMMLAATMALTVGALVKADTCGDYEDNYVVGPCALWYDVTLKVKTTGAKAKKVKVVCDDPEMVCYRVTSSKTFKGIYATCDCDCESFVEGSLWLWNTKDKLFYAYCDEIQWNKMWRIGKPDKQGRASVVEADLQFENAAIAFWAQGFGKFDVKNYRVKNISGRLIGSLLGPSCGVACDDDEGAIVWDCDMNEDSDDTTVAFGTWNMKYNNSKSKSLAKSNSVIPLLPVRYGFMEGVDNDCGGGTVVTPTVFSVIVNAGVGGTAGTSGTFAPGATVSITATADEGYEFAGWTTTSAGVSFVDAAVAATTFVMPANNVTVTASFLAIVPPPEFELAVNVDPEEAGTTAEGIAGTYAEGTEVAVEAIVTNAFYGFVNWTADAGVFANPFDAITTFTMPDTNATITANFAPAHEVTVLVQDDNGETNGVAGTTGFYAEGALVTITATPNEGFSFAGWTTGDDVDFADASSAITSFLMPNNDVTITANFEPLPELPGAYTAIVKAKDGGTVGGGATEYDSQYTVGFEVPLVAEADDGFEFVKWWSPSNGVDFGDSWTNAIASFSMPTNDVVVWAKFQSILEPPDVYEVTVIAKDGGSATLEGGDASDFFEEGDEVFLTAEADDGFVFWKWWTSDDEIVFGDAFTNETSFFMSTNDVTIYAKFKAIEPEGFNVAVIAKPCNGGTATGAGFYAEGDEVFLTAEAEDGFVFWKWWTADDEIVFGDAFTNETSFIMSTNDVTVYAKFKSIEDDYLVEVTSGCGGTATLEGGDASGRFVEGAEVSLVATPAYGYKFWKWVTDDDEIVFDNAFTNETSFIMSTNDVVVKAKFKPVFKKLNVTLQSDTNHSSPDSSFLDNLGGWVQVGTTVTINVVSLGHSSAGWSFVGWGVTSVDPAVDLNDYDLDFLKDGTDSFITFTMPNTKVNVVANFDRNRRGHGGSPTI